LIRYSSDFRQQQREQRRKNERGKAAEGEHGAPAVRLEKEARDHAGCDLAEREADIDERDRGRAHTLGEIFAHKRNRARHRAADPDAGQERNAISMGTPSR